MNIKEIALNEIHLHPHFIDEGISALLHTILYLRAPNSLKFQDHECMYLAPLSFAKSDAEDVDLTVRDAISNLLKLKSSIGPQKRVTGTHTKNRVKHLVRQRALTTPRGTLYSVVLLLGGPVELRVSVC
jgi:hypothetical protein